MCARALGIASGIALSVGGCTVDPPTAPASAPGLVVFGVLDPTATEQVVLLMRSRASAPSSIPLFNAADPIVSSGETPITGATVVITATSGDSAVLIEDRVRRTDRLGAGVYRLFSGSPTVAAPGAYLPVRAGQVYRLRVRSTLGEAEGEARVPSATPGLITSAGATSLVRLGRDSVVLPTVTVTGATGFVYSLRTVGGGVEGETQYRRTLERRLVLATGADWAFAYARDRLIVGSRHVLTVQAADSSYFGYYGADTDPFADRSVRTTLRGAAGVFGAVLPVAAVPITISP